MSACVFEATGFKLIGFFFFFPLSGSFKLLLQLFMQLDRHTKLSYIWSQNSQFNFLVFCNVVQFWCYFYSTPPNEKNIPLITCSKKKSMDLSIDKTRQYLGSNTKYQLPNFAGSQNSNKIYCSYSEDHKIKAHRFLV